MAARPKNPAGRRVNHVISSNGHGCTIVKLSRAQIVDSLEKGARARIGLSARTMLRRYRNGRLSDPSRVADLVALSNLLRKNDPILAE
jgi:hypothetical protein